MCNLTNIFFMLQFMCNCGREFGENPKQSRCRNLDEPWTPLVAKLGRFGEEEGESENLRSELFS